MKHRPPGLALFRHAAAGAHLLDDKLAALALRRLRTGLSRSGKIALRSIGFKGPEVPDIEMVDFFLNPARTRPLLVVNASSNGRQAREIECALEKGPDLWIDSN